MIAHTGREDVKSLLTCEDNSASEYTSVGRSKTRQHVAAILANLATLCIGMANAWTAPALPLIERQTDVILPLYATEEQASWISSLLPIGAVVGALPAGFMADKFGRKKVLLMMAVPFYFGWVLIALANDSVLLVYMGRFIIGLAAGSCSVLVLLYSEEIAEDSIRCSLGVYFDFMFGVGVLVTYVLGAALQYVYFTKLCSLAPVIFVIAFFWMPESPTFLVTKQLLPEAEKSLMWLRNGSVLNDVEVQSEIRRLTSRVQDVEGGSSTRWNRTTLKAAGIIFGLTFFQQLSGVNAFLSYTVEIFEYAGNPITATACSIVIAVVQVMATLISATGLDSFGRRPLLLLSSSFMAIWLAVLSVYVHFKEIDLNTTPWMWGPLISLTGYMIALSAGFGPLPYLMIAELVPSSVKGKVCAISIAFSWTLIAFVIKFFPYMLRNVGQAITYGSFCCMCILATIFVHFCVPETKGKSREEIQCVLRNTLS